MNAITKIDIIDSYLDEIKKLDVSQDLLQMIFPFCLSTELWEKFNKFNNESKLIDFSKFQGIKYFGDGKTLSKDIEKVPNDSGGIYIYVVENSVIPFSGKYIMYVGRARLTDNCNLRQRARSHFSQYKRGEENDRMERVFDNWSDYVYLFYLQMGDNDFIDLAEKELINALTPPCNKDDYAPQIRRKLSASFF